MSPGGRPKKRQPTEKVPSLIEPKPGVVKFTREVELPQEEFPYKTGQICADVKIVEIKPGVERSIGFVYAKRGAIKDDRDRVVNTDGILHGQWQEEIHWMTISDFKSFVQAQIENGQFVRGGI